MCDIFLFSGGNWVSEINRKILQMMEACEDERCDSFKREIKMLNMIAYYICGSREFKRDTPFIKDNMVPWCLIEKLVMLFGWKGLEQSDSEHTGFSPVLNKRFEGLFLNSNVHCEHCLQTLLAPPSCSARGTTWSQLWVTMAFKLHVPAVQAVANGGALHRWLRLNGKYPAQGWD